MNVCILIPVHNEALNIGWVVEALQKRHLDVVVVDDGSVDQSGALAQQKGAVVLRHEIKKGKGVALQTGFRYILEKNYEALITMDGDGQHEVTDIDLLIAEWQEYPQAIINGNRMGNPRGMPLVRRSTNWMMSRMISVICRQHIPDTQCGFRLIPCHLLRQLNLAAKDFEIETEILLEASKKRIKIYSVPIQTIYRNELSKINPWVDTIRFVHYMVRELLNRKS